MYTDAEGNVDRAFIDHFLGNVTERLPQVILRIKIMKSYMGLPGFPPQLRAFLQVLLPLTEMSPGGVDILDFVKNNPKVIGGIYLLELPPVTLQLNGNFYIEISHKILNLR